MEAWDECSTVDELFEVVRTQQEQEGLTLEILDFHMLHSLLNFGEYWLEQGIEHSQLDSLSKVLDFLAERVVANMSARRAHEVESFFHYIVMIEQFHWKVELKCGMRMSLDGLIEQIKSVERLMTSHEPQSYPYYAQELARRYDGLLTSRIPWDDIWGHHLFDTMGVTNLGHQRRLCPQFTLNSRLHIYNKRSPTLLLSFPVEIIRHILYFGAESLLPIARSSLLERETLHLRRSHFLTNAALSHSIFRQQAQEELVSFAYCNDGFRLDGLLDFLQNKGMTRILRRLRLDFSADEGEEISGDSLERLFHTDLPHLFFIDLSGHFSGLTLGSLEQGSLRPKALGFSHLTNEYCPDVFKLPPSVTDLFWDCCDMYPVTYVFGVEPNILKLTVTEDITAVPLWEHNLVIRDPTPVLFPNVTHLQIDTRFCSFKQLLLEFPSATQLELLHFDALKEDSAFVLDGFGLSNIVTFMALMKETPAVRTLILPPMLQDCSESVKKLEGMGIVVKQKKELDSDEVMGASPPRQIPHIAFS